MRENTTLLLIFAAIAYLIYWVMQPKANASPMPLIAQGSGGTYRAPGVTINPPQNTGRPASKLTRNALNAPVVVG